MAIITLNNNSLVNADVGKVLQVVSSTITYNTITTSTSYIDVLSASGTTWETAITLSSSSNKVLILPTIMTYGINSSGSELRYSLITLGKIGGGSYSQIGDSGTAGRFGAYDYGGSGLVLGQTHCSSFLWSPSSTNELKIKFQIKTSGGEIETSRSNYRSVVNLLEVQG